MLVAVRTLVHLRYFLKAAVLHYFPSRVWLDAAVLRCCLFPVHFSRSATSIELACGSDSDACYAALLRSHTETFRGLNSCICALTRNFLKATVLHHFPSRVLLDAVVLCCCLFPVRFRLSATSTELGWSWCNLAPDRKHLFTAVVSLKTSKLACGSNSDVFDVSLLCSLTVFSVGRHLALLPFRSGAMLVTVGKIVHYAIF